MDGDSESNGIAGISSDWDAYGEGLFTTFLFLLTLVGLFGVRGWLPRFSVCCGNIIRFPPLFHVTGLWSIRAASLPAVKFVIVSALKSQYIRTDVDPDSDLFGLGLGSLPSFPCTINRGLLNRYLRDECVRRVDELGLLNVYGRPIFDSTLVLLSLEKGDDLIVERTAAALPRSS